ncbi:hypothetical protein SEA_COMRADE_142 [Streptomyces phage Comrade]|uniref:Uncharacterized protein n=1 Tax=Streptomyces phage Comrade TaxID=2301714 RepID=A0A385DXZ4_9CAUD|nr:hypothetical protein HWB84_gp126 [Streptomyces phage Comrade]AXQ63389.1 hypothetical protein SEA_COMRADE_142 [Streptomyces phage Comrade]UTN92377.1 hypothetical protein SEA_STIGMA_143 [Streptomyces phage Stigma]
MLTWLLSSAVLGVMLAILRLGWKVIRGYDKARKELIPAVSSNRAGVTILRRKKFRAVKTALGFKELAGGHINYKEYEPQRNMSIMEYNLTLK